jgi:hypothetical protein
MDEWKKVRINGIANIEKCVAEFNVWELNKSPYAKFKVKIFESNKGNFTGYSNLQVIDELGSYYCAVGYGQSSEEALEDTINHFFTLVSRKDKWDEADFSCSDSFDF